MNFPAPCTLVGPVTVPATNGAGIIFSGGAACDELSRVVTRPTTLYTVDYAPWKGAENISLHEMRIQLVSRKDMVDTMASQNPPLSPFTKGGRGRPSSPPFRKGNDSIPPFRKGNDSIPPFPKGNDSIPPFRKGGLGGIYIL